MAFKRSQQRRKVETEAEVCKEDPIEAVIALQKQLETFPVVQNYKWDDYMYSKLPTSLLPKAKKNAEIVNAVLVKSWEIQGSHCPKLGTGPLMPKNCKEIHVFLMYYFKRMNIADNMERIIGSADVPRVASPFVHSFLKIDGHIIDNTFFADEMKSWDTIPFEMFKACSASKYNDGDPADPKYGVIPQSSNFGNDKSSTFNSLLNKKFKIISLIGLENERLLNGDDDNAEQNLVIIKAGIQSSTCGILDKSIIYDNEMRKFIKEKYGIEIESLAKKWSRLCWNCSVAVENLKRCSKCRTARYCGKDCQAQDWKKVHKIAHVMQERFLRVLQ